MTENYRQNRQGSEKIDRSIPAFGRAVGHPEGLVPESTGRLIIGEGVHEGSIEESTDLDLQGLINATGAAPGME